MDGTYQHIQFRVEDRVGRITFARPPLNVFNIAMMREIDAALGECAKESDLAAVLFDAAAGSRAFSAGVAVEEHVAETIRPMLEAFHRIFLTLERMAKPALAVVDGAALGGGCELVAACDVVISSPRARFGQPEIKLGVFPPVAALLLPRLVGERRARTMILTGEPVDAEEALHLGLVSHLVPSEQLEQKAQEILALLRDLSAASLSVTRRALDAARGLSLAKALPAVEKIYLDDLMKTEDAPEGIRAFTEKRKPAWRNR